MQVRGRALYNLLRLMDMDHQNVKPWQIENMRNVSDESIFNRLHHFKIFIDQESFVHFAECVENPEELLEYLVSTESDREKAEQIYLLLFELWRRYMKDTQCLSIVCDEIDALIEQFDNGDLSISEELYAKLYHLVDVFDESVNVNQPRQVIFEYVCSYLAHDLERFLYDFIQILIENKNESLASELIEGYEDYVKHPEWLEFLKLKLISASEAVDVEGMLARFGDRLIEEKNVSLAIDFVSYLFDLGDSYHCMNVFPSILKLVTTNAQLNKIIGVTDKYLETLDRKSVV